MNEFWIVCAWYHYYPCGGVDNIIGVFIDKDIAEEFLEMKKKEGHADCYEIYSSNELPWMC